MKKCTYCGKEYPDDTNTCPIDGHTLVGGNAPSERITAEFVPSPARKRIARISIVQTAKVLTLCYVALSLMFIPFGVLMILLGQTGMGTFYLLMPIIYGIIGFPAIALGLWVYNVLARKTGGIEFVVEEERVTTAP
jgi:hypothetical protein